jgi:hypothetical protein
LMMLLSVLGVVVALVMLVLSFPKFSWSDQSWHKWNKHWLWEMVIFFFRVMLTVLNTKYILSAAEESATLLWCRCEFFLWSLFHFVIKWVTLTDPKKKGMGVQHRSFLCVFIVVKWKWNFEKKSYNSSVSFGCTLTCVCFSPPSFFYSLINLLLLLWLLV